MNALLRPFSLLVVSAALLAATAAHAQAAAPDAEKQKLIDRAIAALHPENGVVAAVQRVGIEAMQKTAIALQTNHVPQDRAEKTMKEVGADVQAFIDKSTPVVLASARKNMGTTVAPLLAQNFTTEELKQLVAMLESPLKAKLEKIVPQFEKALGEKVQADVAPEINKNIQTMTEAVGTKLRVAATLK